ncbi:MAG: bifunctional folylpolyglutamate synthase/dihydrofolate synthase [Bacillota bacterium]
MKFKNLKDAQAWIESVIRFTDKFDLSRMEKAVKMLGHPEQAVPTIHIGGTNGKGSTLQFLKRILMASGYTVGSYTSPYVVKFNERIAIDDTPIDDRDLLHYINIIYDFQATYLEMYNDQISFFELLTLISFLYFKDKSPDVVLYEVGLGGTLDATNVIAPELAIITSIGHDHMHILGDTLEKVAKQKLGIVKKGVPLATGITQDFLKPVFISYTNEIKSPLYLLSDHPIKAYTPGPPTTFVHDHEPYAIHAEGAYQVRNARLALLASDVLNRHTDFTVPNHAKKRGLSEVAMPGRFERIGNTILDGAHNPEGIEAGIETLKTYDDDTKVTVLFSVMKDKEYATMIKDLKAIASSMVFTQIDMPRALEANDLLNLCGEIPCQVEKDYKRAYEKALDLAGDGILYACGSLYFISALRQHITNQS